MSRLRYTECNLIRWFSRSLLPQIVTHVRTVWNGNNWKSIVWEMYGTVKEGEKWRVMIMWDKFYFKIQDMVRFIKYLILSWLSLWENWVKATKKENLECWNERDEPDRNNEKTITSRTGKQYRVLKMSREKEEKKKKKREDNIDRNWVLEDRMALPMAVAYLEFGLVGVGFIQNK